MDHARDSKTCDEAIGPVFARVQGRYGIGELLVGTPNRNKALLNLNKSSLFYIHPVDLAVTSNPMVN
ncbi:MAG: hypothetical protein H7256_09545 [Bdellovibrio sp.]|nr:hypothetical protein [Bdellovibrio sp.]